MGLFGLSKQDCYNLGYNRGLSQGISLGQSREKSDKVIKELRERNAAREKRIQKARELLLLYYLKNTPETELRKLVLCRNAKNEGSTDIADMDILDFAAACRELIEEDVLEIDPKTQFIRIKRK
ncbi:MAG: hypothetical protein R3346_03650 [Candidatus Spechtbacterales bacterium]|nr:hypothetical protein [Candidatus Spechtbacterales bacterium]